MPRYTSAYSALVMRLKEVEILRNYAGQRERSDPVSLRHEINALCRGSIVLLCSHLEGYVKELGEVALDSMYARNVDRAPIKSQLYYHISKNYLDEIRELSEPEKIGDKVFTLLQSDSQFWSRTGPFPQPIPVDRFNKGFSNPGYGKVKAYFNRFGYSGYDGDLARYLRAGYPVAKNMVNHLVDTRNRIAHGDPSVTKTPSDLRDMISIIRSYCIATDSVFGTWWRTNFCSIR